eukprot:scaffold459_cov249-Pinguiococcus_pyrenoidosus.AAC.15
MALSPPRSRVQRRLRRRRRLAASPSLPPSAASERLRLGTPGEESSRRGPRLSPALHASRRPWRTPDLAAEPRASVRLAGKQGSVLRCRKRSRPEAVLNKECP